MIMDDVHVFFFQCNEIIFISREMYLVIFLEEKQVYIPAEQITNRAVNLQIKHSQRDCCFFGVFLCVRVLIISSAL